MGRFPKQERAIHADEVRLGRVNGVFGVRGEVRLFLHNRDSTLFAADGFEVTLVSPDGERLRRKVVSRSGAGKRILGRIDGVSDPGSARSFMNWEMVCSEADLPVPGDDEYYHRDLIGMTVQNPDGHVLGRLTDVLVGEVVDCWQIESHEGELIVPAIKEVVLSVDVAAGLVVIVPPPSLEE